MTLQTRLEALVGAIGADIKNLSGRVTTVEGTNKYDTAPVGTVLTWSRKALPEGYVMGDGARYTKAAYPQGYATAQAEVAAGNPMWTARSSDETFTVPNLTDKFIFAPGANAMGATGGSSRVTLSAAESGVGPHGHGTNDPGHQHGAPLALAPTTGHGAGSYTGWVAGTDGWAGAGGNNGSYIPFGFTGVTVANHGGAAASNSHENMPPFVVMAQIVKLFGVTASATVIQGPPGPPGAATIVPQEAWHNVGAAGEPAFQNGWVNYDAVNYQPAAFHKDPAGIVRIRGTIKTGGANTVAFTLPVGYRPAKLELLPADKNPLSHARVVVYPNGNVEIGGDATYTSLAGISFSTDQTTFPAGKSIVPVVTALPAGATEGDEIIMSTGTRRWHLRYEQTTQRWYSVGGATPLHSGPLGAISFNSTAPNIPGGGPSLTVPFKGRYVLEIGAYLEVTAGGAPFLQGQAYKNGAGLAGALMTAKGCGAKCMTASEQDFLANDAVDFRVFGNTPTTAYYGDNFHLSLIPMYLSL